MTIVRFSEAVIQIFLYITVSGIMAHPASVQLALGPFLLEVKVAGT
jgi:hypothetical protein